MYWNSSIKYIKVYFQSPFLLLQHSHGVRLFHNFKVLIYSTHVDMEAVNCFVNFSQAAIIGSGSTKRALNESIIVARI